MAKKWYTAEQIMNSLREAEILLSQGETIATDDRFGSDNSLASEYSRA